MLLPLVVDPAISYRIKARGQARPAGATRGLWSFACGEAYFPHPCQTEFIYPCSHLSNAGTEQFTMAGEMGLTTSPVSIALHGTGYSSLSACRGCKCALSRLVLPTWWHRHPLRLRRTCMLSDYLPPDLHLYSCAARRSSGRAPRAASGSSNRADVACRVTVGPLPTCYTASESAI